MMDSLKLNNKHDLDLSEGRLNFLSKPLDILHQQLLITLRMFRGEWFRNIDYGVPWTTNDENDISILGKSTLIEMEAQVAESLLKTGRQFSIDNISAKKNSVSGEATLTIKVSTPDGDIDINNFVLN